MASGIQNPLTGPSVYSTKHAVGQAGKHHRGNSVDALNNSVEMRGKLHMVAGKPKHPREQSVRISRFNNSNSISDGQDNLLNRSVHDFERAKHKAADHLESLSVSGSHHQAKLNEISGANYIRKDADGKQGASMHISPAESQQAGEEGDKLNKNIQLNLQNLIQIDEKLTALHDCLKKNQFNNVSQLCSEWWELTDEDEYTVAKFHKAYKDERARRELKQQMSQEILSIAIVNYFTSSPEIFRPTPTQLNQVKGLLAHVH